MIARSRPPEPRARPGCPRCGGASVVSWGRYRGRRRYRCGDCRRTFCATTGTPLAYLKKADRWAPFCDCMRAGLTVRRTAAALSVHRDTAFRWRHRLLNAARAGTFAPPGPPRPPKVVGLLRVYQLPFAYSEKGKRRATPGLARRHANGARPSAPRAWILVVRDQRGGLLPLEVTRPGGGPRPTTDEITHLLAPATRAATGLVGGVGRFSPVGLAARRLRLDYRPAPTWDMYPVRLRRWLRRFRGVATRYLTNYVEWHRFAT